MDQCDVGPQLLVAVQIYMGFCVTVEEVYLGDGLARGPLIYIY
jgi:hypothetical protein